MYVTFFVLLNYSICSLTALLDIYMFNIELNIEFSSSLFSVLLSPTLT